MVLILLLLLIPSQLSIHFWPPWASVNNLRIDYLSPTLYFTDILVLGLIFISKIKPKLPLWLIVFATLNILFSVSPLVSIYKWLRLLEYFCLLKCLTHNPKLITHNLSTPLSLTVIWSSLLAWIQFILQRSAGSFWYWLGERPLSLVQAGIAKVQFFGLGLIIRPYSTFPHPNALAGFLLVSVLIIYYLNFKKKLNLSRWSQVTAALTVPITFSRTAIIIELLILVAWLSFKISNFKFQILFLIASAPLLLYSSTLIPGNPRSLPERITLTKTAFNAILHHPFIGAGLGTFPAYSPLRQPVHSIYLLTAAELGLPFSLLILYLLVSKLKKTLVIGHWSLVIAASVIVSTGLVDHYWFTLHQNILLLVLLLAVIKIQTPNAK